MPATDRAAAMLDRPAEDALFAHFAAFFRNAEENRRWNLWNDIPWQRVNENASDPLVEAVLQMYTEELFLPDYSAKLLALLRSSRGRAWFLTRWSYEEGKHILILGEWLARSGKRSDAELKAFSDAVLEREERTLWFPDPASGLVQALVREHGELAGYARLQQLAAAEDDGALAAVTDQLLLDEEAHRLFFLEAIRLVHRSQPQMVEESLTRVEEIADAASTVALLRAALAPGPE